MLAAAWRTVTVTKKITARQAVRKLDRETERRLEIARELGLDEGTTAIEVAGEAGRQRKRERERERGPFRQRKRLPRGTKLSEGYLVPDAPCPAAALEAPSAEHWHMIERLRAELVVAEYRTPDGKVWSEGAASVRKAYTAIWGAPDPLDRPLGDPQEWRRRLAEAFINALHLKAGGKANRMPWPAADAPPEADDPPGHTGFTILKWLRAVCVAPADLTARRIDAALSKATLGHSGGGKKNWRTVVIDLVATLEG
jgi:hypothetical protein